MDKSSNIRAKSGRLMVNINRFILKLAFALAVLSAVVVITVGLDFGNSTLIFAASSSIIFAIAYAVCYYLYKFYNKTKNERIKKDPLLAQIKIMCRVIGFIVGLMLLCLGADLIYRGNMWGILLFIGIIPCATLLNSTKLMSHLSTGCENLAAGILFGYIYLAAMYGVDYFILLAFCLTLICLILQEVFYYFFDIKKHDHENLQIKDLLKIRAKYLARNTLAYIIIYIIVALLITTQLYYALLSSNILNALLQGLPIIISIVSVVFAYVQTFRSNKKETVAPDYNQITDIVAYRQENKAKFGENFNKSLDFVVHNMNKQAGYARKSGEDYYYHCINVANILQNAGLVEEDLLCTALLHDCMEDLPNCTEQDIAKITNTQVAHSVSLLTKQKNIDYHTGDNLTNYLQNILSDQNATLVKIADRMHNLSTLKNYSQEKIIAKYHETKAYFLPFVEEAISLYPQAHNFLIEAKNYFESLA